MTVDLNMMIDLRDLQVAMDVAKKAEMGWFDVEFTMYACSYAIGEKRYYKISAEAEKIYDFIENSRQNGCIAGNIMKMTKKCPVPVGMKEYIARDVKKELGKSLREKYSLAFFKYLEQVAEEAEEERALPILQKEWEQVEGCFNQEKLRRFEEMVKYAYECRKIKEHQYEQFKSLIAEERKNMEEDLISKDIFEKTFYGIAYEDKGKIEYLDNAGKAYIYRKKDELEGKGIFVTPIYEKKYWYNYTLRLPQVHKMFEEEMRAYVNEDYIAKIKEMVGTNERMSREEFAKKVDYAQRTFGEEAAATLQHYAIRWGINL